MAKIARPRSQLGCQPTAACFVNIPAKLLPTLASTPSDCVKESWEWVAPFTALTAWSVLRTCLAPQEARQKLPGTVEVRLKQLKCGTKFQLHGIHERVEINLADDFLNYQSNNY